MYVSKSDIPVDPLAANIPTNSLVDAKQNLNTKKNFFSFLFRNFAFFKISWCLIAKKKENFYLLLASVQESST